MTDQRCSGFRASGHDVQHTGGQASLKREFAEAEGRERRLLGRLKDNGVAAGQRRAELPACQQQREIPGNDSAYNSNRFAQGVSKSIVEGVDGFAVDLGGPSRVVAKNVSDHGQVYIARFEDGLAIVEGLEFGQFINVLFDEISDAPQYLAAFTGRHLAPWACCVLECLADGGYGLVYIFLTGIVNLSKHLAGDGVHISK